MNILRLPKKYLTRWAHRARIQRIELANDIVDYAGDQVDEARTSGSPPIVSMHVGLFMMCMAAQLSDMPPETLMELIAEFLPYAWDASREQLDAKMQEQRNEGTDATVEQAVRNAVKH